MEENKLLEEAAKEARRQYSREWRARNKDRVREINRRYWAKKAQQMQQGGGEADAKADI